MLIVQASFVSEAANTPAPRHHYTTLNQGERCSCSAQGLADRADGGFRHRLQRFASDRLLARIGRLRPPGVGCGGVDRAVGVQHEAP
ncbi:MAG TPA: hypothetical protein VHK01_22590 [Lacipirellulaceae bacterium]|nr:hypothetical protein [Lacipirellulaceae bacterium]